MVHPIVTLSQLSFTWPDGSTVLDGLDATFTTGRTGLIGLNGTGKSTLLRLVAGELQPTSGTVKTAGQTGYLPQQLTLDTSATVARLLGVADQLTALRAIEAGDASVKNFDVLADDWDVEARSLAVLARFGLSTIGLERTVGTLSGGESVLVALAGLQLAGNPIVLLDEPTNNLDRLARSRLYHAVQAWHGTMIVVSHDTELLDLMDATAELRAGSLEVFGGNYSAFTAHIAQEQAAAQQAVRTAAQKVQVEQRQRIEAQTKLARRQRYANTDFANKRKPKIIMNMRKRDAQVSAGKLRGMVNDRVSAAQHELAQHEGRVRHDAEIAIDLPDPEVPASKRLARLGTVVIQGPERVALVGRNGIGKTRLLNQLVAAGQSGDSEPDAGTVAAYTSRIGYLPQRLDQLDDATTIFDTVRAQAPDTAPAEVRAQLARFLFRGDIIYQRVGDLSGGERFRVALAALLLAVPAHQLLILDEPTNNLDLGSMHELVTALSSYRGGLLVVSHDNSFLERLGIDAWLELSQQGITPIG